jgi:hypothetical protein
VIAALAALSLVGVFAASSGAVVAHKAAAKPATWVIGNIGTYSGINDSNFVGGGQTLEAWALYTNAHGGIDGHHVKIISYDDAGNATTSENDVKQLVADHVIAIVAMNSGEDSTWDAYIQSTGIPVIGGSTPLPDFASNPDYFPVGATANNSVPDLLLYAKNVLHQTMGGYLGCEARHWRPCTPARTRRSAGTSPTTRCTRAARRATPRSAWRLSRRACRIWRSSGRRSPFRRSPRAAARRATTRRCC